MSRELEFWFEFASTYSHIAAQRVESAAARAGVALLWRPFLLGPVFAKQGWNDSPFNLYPAKGAYMWRDMERECAKFGIPFRRPSKFPRNGLLVARAALAGESEPWIARFVRAVYLGNFAEDADIADPKRVSGWLEAAGCPDSESHLATAESPQNKDRLRARTEDAIARGIFGAPTFLVNGELFWGNDRLEDALAWLLRRNPRGAEFE
jgi:2-hydroxychromene-2-carboxylate isomerase